MPGRVAKLLVLLFLLPAHLGSADAGQSPPAAAAVPAGPGGVGYRLMPVQGGDARPGVLRIWYPADACAAPLRYADYLHGPDGGTAAGNTADELRRGLDSPDAPIADDAWARVLATPFRACRDTAPAAGRAPLILALHLPGAWPIAAEWFAAHGYVFASVERAPGRPAGTDLPARIAQRMIEFVDDLEVAQAALAREGLVDPDQVGVIGQNHALLMFAMRHVSVRAVALQDSGFRADPSSDAAGRTGLWSPSTLRAALLHVIPRERLDQEARWDAFRDATPAPWTRVIVNAPSGGHADVTSDGHLVRTRVPLRTGPHQDLVRAFESLLRAQLAFFDRHVATRAGAPAIDRVLDGALFTIERGARPGGRGVPATAASSARHASARRSRQSPA